nr:glycosyltransferase [Mangrovicoccus ximenensis]
MIRGLPLSISAHAKDIWTSPDWDLREKLGDARWTVTCTRSGRDHLAALAPGAAVHLLYHGLDLERFPPAAPAVRDGGGPVRILAIGRAVPKKGFDTILSALAQLPPELDWTFEHAGGGAGLDRLKKHAARLGLGDRVRWLGPLDQTAILALYRRSDIFVMGSRAHSDGDRDGLPNVLVEAASQGMACVATRFTAIPEFIDDGGNGLLVPPEDSEAMSAAIARLIRDPGLRRELGTRAAETVRSQYDFRPGISRLAGLLGIPAPGQGAARRAPLGRGACHAGP